MHLCNLATFCIIALTSSIILSDYTFQEVSRTAALGFPELISLAISKDGNSLVGIDGDVNLYAYFRSGNGWNLTSGFFAAASFTAFTGAIALSRDGLTFVLGTPDLDTFWIYSRPSLDSLSWTMFQNQTTSSNITSSARLGHSVAISDNASVVAIGAYKDNNGKFLELSCDLN